MGDSIPLSELPRHLAGLSAYSQEQRAEVIVALPPPALVVPGEPCPCCRRVVPTNRLQLLMDQNQESYQTLACKLSEWPAVRARLRAGGGKLTITRNIVYRLAHQAPGWRPRPSTVAFVVLDALLQTTGLPLEALRNMLPTAPGFYSCGDPNYTEARALARAGEALGKENVDGSAGVSAPVSDHQAPTGLREASGDGSPAGPERKENVDGPTSED